MRTLQIMHQISPQLYSRIMSISPPKEEWMHFTYDSSVFGNQKNEPYRKVNQFSRYKYYPAVDEFVDLLNQKYSWTLPTHLSQNKLVNLLRNQCLQKKGIEIKMGMELKMFEFQEKDKNSKNKETGLEARCFNYSNQKLQFIKSKIIVATDGSGSLTRSLIKTKLDNNQSNYYILFDLLSQYQLVIQNFLSFHFFSQKISELLKQKKRDDAMIYFIYTVQSVSVLVCHNYQLGEFVLQVPVLRDDIIGYWEWKQSQVKQLIISCITQSQDSNFIQQIKNSITLSDYSQWRMVNGVAQKWSNSQSNVILAGDSAHVFPPAGGYGLNTGVQDAHCLAHKLKNIFDSNNQFDENALKNLIPQYQKQRKQISKQIRKFAGINYKKSKDVAKSFGLNYEQALRMANVVNTYFPKFMRPYLIQTGLAIGRFVILSNKANIQRGKQYLEEDQNSIPLLFPNQDTGYKYCQEGLDQLLLDNFDQVENEVIRVEKGCLIPHIWMKVLSNSKSGKRVKVQSLRQFHAQNYFDLKRRDAQLTLRMRSFNKGQLRAQQLKIILEAVKIQHFQELFKGVNLLKIRSDGHISQCVLQSNCN